MSFLFNINFIIISKYMYFFNGNFSAYKKLFFIGEINGIINTIYIVFNEI